MRPIPRQEHHFSLFARIDRATSRDVPVLDPRFTHRGEYVVATLDRVCRASGYPKTIRVDQDSEFISRDMDQWIYSGVSRSTSQDPASQPTTPTSRPSIAGSGRNASTVAGL